MRARVFGWIVLVGFVGGCSGAKDSSIETVALALSGVHASGITSTSATISWGTNENATSEVEYGLSVSYGASTPLYGLELNHDVDLTGLSPATTYHYRVKSVDPQGNVATSGDATFTTLANPDGGPPGDAGSGGPDGGTDAGTPDSGTPDSGTRPDGGIPASFFGMHISRSADFIPDISTRTPFGMFRVWDAENAQWPDVETCEADSGSPSDHCFNWAGVDGVLSRAKDAGADQAMY